MAFSTLVSASGIVFANKAVFQVLRVPLHIGLDLDPHAVHAGGDAHFSEGRDV